MAFIIHCASRLGICCGVRAALEIAGRAVSENAGPVYALGEPVHNEKAVAALSGRGLVVIPAVEDAPPGATVLLRAHGSTGADQAALAAKGCRSIDATCSALKRSRGIIDAALAAGRRVVLFGDSRHVECLALADGRPTVLVLQSANAIPAPLLSGPAGLTVLCQSSSPPSEFEAFIDAVKKIAAPGLDLAISATICGPVRCNHRCLEELLPRVQMMLVVGGAHSANSLGLAAVAAKSLQTLYVSSPDELFAEAFERVAALGLIGGTSTPIEAVVDVIEALERFGGSLAPGFSIAGRTAPDDPGDEGE